MIQSQCGMKWMCKCHKHHIKYIYGWNQSWFSVVWNECASVANTTSNIFTDETNHDSVWCEMNVLVSQTPHQIYMKMAKIECPCERVT